MIWITIAVITICVLALIIVLERYDILIYGAIILVIYAGVRVLTGPYGTVFEIILAICAAAFIFFGYYGAAYGITHMEEVDLDEVLPEDIEKEFETRQNKPNDLEQYENNNQN